MSEDEEALWPPREETVVPNPWKARALAYEQALREVVSLFETNDADRNAEWWSVLGKIDTIARAALDKPGTEVEVAK